MLIWSFIACLLHFLVGWLCNKAHASECLSMFCNTTKSETNGCHLCSNLSSFEMAQWQRYIDTIVKGLRGASGQREHYLGLRESPGCCKLTSDNKCFAKLVNESKVEPRRVYELSCSSGIFAPIFCKSVRCCESRFCNIPTDEEIQMLVQDDHARFYIIVICVIVVVAFIIILISMTLLRRYYHKAGRQQASNLGSCTANPQLDGYPWSNGDAAENMTGLSTAPVGSYVIVGPVGGNGVDPLLPLTMGSVQRSAGMGTNTSVVTSLVTLPLNAPMHTSSFTASVPRGSEATGLTSRSGYRGLGPGGSCAPPSTSGVAGAMLSSQEVGISGPSGCLPEVSLRDMLELTGSGSGSGLPLLVQRTVARQVHLEERIGEGRYGEVWRGTWQCDQVAAKIFSSRDESSWKRETQIYQTVTLRHANILGFIAADNKDNGLSTELWLITEYHRLGSLYEFLQSHVVDAFALIRMASSIVNGLAHLHTEIAGTQGKPAIAHRDLKSRNILVKDDGECCIGDLGFAVKLDSASGHLDVGYNPERVGTKRYMAPEVLDNTLRQSSFDAYKQADMYSLGLVFWELTRRCRVPDLYEPEEYQLPYQDIVAPDPSIEEMKSVVCEQGLRPFLRPVWTKHKILNVLRDIMTECWYASPVARLPAMRIKKDLRKFLRSEEAARAMYCSTPSVSNSSLPRGVFVHDSSTSVSLYPPVSAPIKSSGDSAAAVDATRQLPRDEPDDQATARTPLLLTHKEQVADSPSASTESSSDAAVASAASSLSIETKKGPEASQNTPVAIPVSTTAAT